MAIWSICSRPALTLAIALSSTAASPADAVLRHAAATPDLRAGGAPLMAFGSRGVAPATSAAMGKLDATLAGLIRHAGHVHPGNKLADLQDISPAAHFRQASASGAALVAVDVVTRGDPQLLKDALLQLGFQQPSIYANDVGGWLPVSQIAAAASRTEVHSLRAAMYRTRAGLVTTQGDFVQGSSAPRTAYPALTGSGVTIGVLSDSYNCYATYAAPGSGVPASGLNGYANNGFLATAATDQSTDDVPAGVDVLKEAPCLSFGQPLLLPFADEGRAMLQIVHDVAPGATLAFYTGSNSEADFANGIRALATAGAKIIADDLGYFDEPFFQDGLIAQAINSVSAQGVAYFSATGNDGLNAYDNTTVNFSARSPDTPNELLLNFDASGVTQTTTLPVTIPALVPGEFIGIVVEWDQPFVTGASASPGASSQIDLCVTGGAGDTIIDLDGYPVTCTGANATGADPVQVLIIGNPASATANTSASQVNVTIGLANGTAAPGRIKLAVEDNGAGAAIASAFNTHSPTLQGHPGAAGAAAVGAAYYLDTPACGTSPATLETYSSAGGTPILFDVTGNRLTSPIVRQKPDFVGPDGVNTTFFGFVLSDARSTISQCQNNAGLPSFFGTSAATPHVAAAAALMMQANPAATPAQIIRALQSSALQMGTAAPNFSSGYGFIKVDAALALLPPAAPTLTFAPSTIPTGGTTTLSWSEINATSCTASGAWNGTVAASGTQTIAPTTAGGSIYTLTCSNAAGSASTSATLNVQAPSVSTSSGGGGGGGGGSLDVSALLALTLLTLMRRMQLTTSFGMFTNLRARAILPRWFPRS